jgi:hypothetical protein
VKIPTGKTVTVNIPDAKAKNITIKSGGKLEIAGNLTVEEKVVNENTGTGAADQFVLLSSTENSNANYLQNSNTPNTSADGVMRAERRVTDMDNVLSGTNAQMDYVYWSAPVAGQDLQAFSPGTPANRIYQYNEPTDLFVKATGNFVPAKRICNPCKKQENPILHSHLMTKPIIFGESQTMEIYQFQFKEPTVPVLQELATILSETRIHPTLILMNSITEIPH